LAKTFFEEGYLHYQDLPMIDLSVFQELNHHERALIKLSKFANLSIPEFVALSPLRRSILVNNADKIQTMATYQTFAWQEFFNLPKDIVDMDGGEQQQLGRLFNDNVLTKQSFLAFSSEQRKIIIDKESEIRVFHKVGINLNEILSLDEQSRHDVCYFSHTICRLMKDKSYSPELIKTRLFELLSSDNSAYYKLLAKVRDWEPEGVVLFNNLMTQGAIQNVEPVNTTTLSVKM
jgi:hypothetical protein